MKEFNHKDTTFVVLFISTLCFLFLPFIISRTNVHLFQDDFYYYSEVAKNYVIYGFPTFDGNTATNGFHPLYFYLLTPFTYLFKTNSFQFFFTINSLIVLSVIITYSTALKLINNFSTNEYNHLFSFIVAVVHLTNAKGAMENILTVPLLIYFSKLLLIDKRLVFSNFIGSLVILSRLDSIIFIALLNLFYFYYHRNLTTRIVFKIFTAYTLLIIYLISNIVYFETLLPVSGLAKQLKLESGFRFMEILESIYSFSFNKVLFVYFPLLLSPFILYKVIKMKLSNNEKIITYSSLIFPVIYIIIQSYFSSWQFWPWYMYIFLPIALSYFLVYGTSLNVNKYFYYSCLCFFMIWTIGYTAYKNSDIDKHKELINVYKNYIKDDGSVIAQGDRSGTHASSLQRNIVQLEGLVMDKKYLNYIKNGDLNKILVDYNVRYYVTLNPEYKNGKWYCEEPTHPYKFIHKAKGIIDKVPLIVYKYDKDSVVIFDLK
jgi:hypothetical protein